jgi:hypothetical protein
MSKRQRPTVVEKIQAKQAQPVLNPVDVQNVIVAARLAVGRMAGADLINVSTSIANIEAAYAPKEPAKPAEEPKP